MFLNVPASSAAVERVFSEAGIILTKQRKHLAAGKLADFDIYIKYVAKYSHLCTSSETPSDSRRLGEICTGDEIWIMHAEPLRKDQSKTWLPKGAPLPKRPFSLGKLANYTRKLANFGNFWS